MANQRQAGDRAEYAKKEAAQRGMNPVPGAADTLFLEIDVVDPYCLEVENFSAAVRGRDTVLIGGDEIVAQAAVIEALYASAETGTAISVA